MKQINLICEAKVSLGQSADESQAPSGKIEARVTTWGAREGADGRRFNYQPEGFAQWADEFANSGKPLPMFLNHNDMGIDRKSTRLNSSHSQQSRMPSSA